MDRTAVTIFTVTMVVVAGCIVYDVFFKTDDSVDPDYSLLQSSDNIGPGLVIETVEFTSNFSSRTKITVESCENGMAECLLTYRSTGLTTNPLSDFDPENFFFNYAESEQTPVGLDVSRSGDYTYVLQGSYTSSDSSQGIENRTDYSFEGFRLILDDGGRCIYAGGKVSYESTVIEGDVQLDRMNVSINCSTSGDSYTSRNSTNYSRIIHIEADSLFSTFIPVFSEEISGGQFGEAVIGQYHSTYYNQHIATYHAIGDCGRYGQEADVIITVYDDYVIGVNGGGISFRVSVYML